MKRRQGRYVWLATSLAPSKSSQGMSRSRM